MPSYTTAKLTIPKSWDEFEDISADIMKIIWKDDYLVRNGRSGQRQNGVDIYGKPANLKGEYAGVQCKDKKITLKEIEKIVKDAESFQPPLKEFIFAVASQRDVKLQEHVRKIDYKRVKKGSFSICILFWEDICLFLANNPELIEKHFPQFVEKKSSYPVIVKKIIESDVDDWLFDDEKGIHTYKKDTNLTIRRADYEDRDEFHEDWLNIFPNKKGYTCHHDIYYGNSFIKKVFIVSVDGGRALIPYPKLDTLTISKFQYAIGKILNCYHHQRKIKMLSFDRYLERAKIKISPNQ